MLATDMINSCSNDKVAQAALACIGGEFAERVRQAAEASGVSPGRFVALAVRNFALRADAAACADLRTKMTGSDQPILSGLRHVLERALEREELRIRRPTLSFLEGAHLPFCRAGRRESAPIEAV